MDNILSLVRWFCSQLTPDELLTAVTVLLEVLDGRRKDIQLKSQFREQHPHYRKFTVDTMLPLTQPPVVPERQPSKDWRTLLAEYRQDHGRDLEPVRRKSGTVPPPSGSRCEVCGAPEAWLYVNDGVKRSQLRCKICDELSPVRRVRRNNRTAYWCPHCGTALYEWKHDDNRTIYKCGNDRCPYYLRNRQELNADEQRLARTGASSQYKVRYQWRRYHFDPAEVQPHAPEGTSLSLLNVRRNLEAVGLALAYAVSYGLSARSTARILREIHGISVSHQTILNWMEAAAPLAWRALEKLKGAMHETAAAADETYIKVLGVWHYTWFVIGVDSRIIWAWEVSDSRGEVPAIAVLNRTLESRPDDVQATLVMTGDGNPSYDAAVNALNTDLNGIPLPPDQRRIERRTVIGLTNDDEQSEQFRPFKEIIERLNRTYRYHTRSRSGHKSLNGARALTTLFVAYYNFLRPHRTLGNKSPVHLPELHSVQNLQGRWLKLLELELAA
jgi:putative transposase